MPPRDAAAFLAQAEAQRHAANERKAEAEHAQEHDEQQARQQRKHQEQSQRLVDQGKLQLGRKEWKSAIKLFQRARAASLKLNDTTAALRIEHRATSGISTAHRCLHDFETAIALGTKAVELAIKLGDEEDAREERKLLDIAYVGEAARLSNLGMEALNPARHRTTKTSGGSECADVDMSDVGAAEAALPMFQQALAIGDHIHDMMMREKVVRNSLLNVGCARFTMNQLDAAIGDFNGCLVLCRKWKDKNLESSARANMEKALRAVQAAKAREDKLVEYMGKALRKAAANDQKVSEVLNRARATARVVIEELATEHLAAQRGAEHAATATECAGGAGGSDDAVVAAKDAIGGLGSGEHATTATECAGGARGSGH